MKQVQVVGPDKVALVEIKKPAFGSNDILVEMKAVGICGSDAFYTHVGGDPPTPRTYTIRPRTNR